jgi:hypothetical protein
MPGPRIEARLSTQERQGTGDDVEARELRVTTLTSLDIAFVGLLTLLIACHVVAALLARGWITAALTDLLAVVYLGALLLRGSWRPLVARLMLLGLIAGILELATDAAGRDVAHSLIYQPGQPLLWASPFSMPVSWMVVLSTVGYLGWRLVGLAPRLPLWLAVGLTAAFGACTIPFYEETAFYAGWWHYAPTALTLGHTPAYVLVFEGLVSAALPLLSGNLLTRSPRVAALRGLLVGAWMPVAAFAAWLALGRW